MQVQLNVPDLSFLYPFFTFNLQNPFQAITFPENICGSD